ncbi:hypothetical protein ACWEQG_01450 [Microbispora sp. NPDC004025]
MTTIRYEELPPDTVVQMWDEDGETIIVVNSTLPPDRQRDAVRAALRDARKRRRGLVVLPIGVILAVEQIKRALRARPIAVAAATSAAAVFTTLGPPQPLEEREELVPPTIALSQRPNSPTHERTPASALTMTHAASAPRQPRTRSPAHRAVSSTRRAPATPSRSPRPHTPRPSPPEPTIALTQIRRPPAPLPSPQRPPQPPPSPAVIVRPEERPAAEAPTPPPPAGDCDGIGMGATLDPLLGIDACLLG